VKFSATHLRRYRQIAGLLWKYGRSDIAQQMAVPDEFDPDELKAGPSDGAPEQLVDDLEAMGPTYVKMGQVLAGRPDLLPRAYLTALARLQDKVKPFSYEEVEQILLAELGVRVSKAFSQFATDPIAAASLGQVHLAALRDGRLVAVKVQRPDIRRQIAEDFEVLAEIATFLDDHTEIGRRCRFSAIVADFRTTIQQELNYEREAQNLIAVGKNLQEFKLIVVPQPVLDYSTRSVLTMDYIKGQKITAIGSLGKQDINGARLAEELFKAYLKQVLVDGLFHADPHPGNVFITDDGRIALLDLGMVGHTGPVMQEHLLKVLIAVSNGKGDEAVEEVVRMSEKTDSFDLHGFRLQISQLVASSHDKGLKDLNVGRTLLDVSRHARECGLYVPSELVLLGKTLLQLDEVGRILDPEFDTNASIRRNAIHIISTRTLRDTTQGGVANAKPDHGRDLERGAGGEGEGTGRKDGGGWDREGGKSSDQGNPPRRSHHWRGAHDENLNAVDALRVSRLRHALLSRGGCRDGHPPLQHLCRGPCQPQTSGSLGTDMAQDVDEPPRNLHREPRPHARSRARPWKCAKSS